MHLPKRRHDGHRDGGRGGSPQSLCLPAATHDHQTHNALELVEQSAALLVLKDLKSSLGHTLDGLFDDRATLAAMGEAARRVAQPQAINCARTGRFIGCRGQGFMDLRRKVKRVHFVGIGGIGQSGIAEVLHARQGL